jgi:hypothetical protein
MAMSPAGQGTKNDCAGENQQQFTRALKCYINLSYIVGQERVSNHFSVSCIFCEYQ